MRTKRMVLVALCGMLAAVQVQAGTITRSATAPVMDENDISNLSATRIGDIKYGADGVENGLGQTFTAVVDKCKITSFTFKLDSARGLNTNDGDPNERLDLRLGIITRPDGVFTFTQIYNELAYLTEDWLLGDHITVTYDTPQELTAGVEYGIIAYAVYYGDWHQGIPYVDQADNTSYAGGHAIVKEASYNADLVFAVSIELPPPAGTVIVIK